MKSHLIELETFEKAIQGKNFSLKTIAIAKQVLVLGYRQSQCVRDFNVSRSHVSQSVKRVRDCIVPKGFERITVVLPTSKARIVKEWEHKFKKLGEDNENNSNS